MVVHGQHPPAAGARLLVKVTLVVWPLGRRIVSPGYVPP